MIWLHKQYWIKRTKPNVEIPTGGCYAWRQNDRVSDLGNTSAYLPAVAVTVKECIDLITQKLAKYALHISPPSLCFWSPVDYDIVAYTAAYIQPVVSALIQQQNIRAQQFSRIYSSQINHPIFSPSFMHAATATRPLALITSQPTTNDYTVSSIGVRFSLSLFFWL